MHANAGIFRQVLLVGRGQFSWVNAVVRGVGKGSFGGWRNGELTRMPNSRFCFIHILFFALRVTGWVSKSKMNSGSYLVYNWRANVFKLNENVLLSTKSQSQICRMFRILRLLTSCGFESASAIYIEKWLIIKNADTNNMIETVFLYREKWVAAFTANEEIFYNIWCCF